MCTLVLGTGSDYNKRILSSFTVDTMHTALTNALENNDIPSSFPAVCQKFLPTANKRDRIILLGTLHSIFNSPVQTMAGLNEGPHEVVIPCDSLDLTVGDAQLV